MRARQPAPDDRPDEGRRARVRRETLAELHAAAMDEIREYGAVALSLRRVARRMGMSPAGLYRYVASREELLTRVIADAYDALGDHLLAALGADDERLDPASPRPRTPEVAGPDRDVTERLRAAALTYRDWGVRHPNAFGLLFGDPIPGYDAPAGGPTVVAMGRVGVGLGRPLVEAWVQGRLRIPQAAAGVVADPVTTERFAPMTQLDGVALPTEVGVVLLQAWGRLHGQVSLEVFGHHRWVFPDSCEALYRADLAAFAEQYLTAA